MAQNPPRALLVAKGALLGPLELPFFAPFPTFVDAFSQLSPREIVFRYFPDPFFAARKRKLSPRKMKLSPREFKLSPREFFLPPRQIHFPPPQHRFSPQAQKFQPNGSAPKRAPLNLSNQQLRPFLPDGPRRGIGKATTGSRSRNTSPHSPFGSPPCRSRPRERSPSSSCRNRCTPAKRPRSA